MKVLLGCLFTCMMLIVWSYAAPPEGKGSNGGPGRGPPDGKGWRKDGKEEKSHTGKGSGSASKE